MMFSRFFFMSFFLFLMLFSYVIFLCYFLMLFSVIFLFFFFLYRPMSVSVMTIEEKRSWKTSLECKTCSRPEVVRLSIASGSRSKTCLLKWSRKELLSRVKVCFGIFFCVCIFLQPLCFALMD